MTRHGVERDELDRLEGIGSSDAVPAPERPPRPIAVELATALVAISGILGILESVDVYSRLADQGSFPAELALVSLVVGVGTIVIGVLLRTGRAWLVGVNVVAVAGFLELISGIPLGIVFGLLDVAVVVVLLIHRPWFAWRATHPDAGPTG